ncbi:MAG: tetratricopeptide repeat protein [Nannocystaceae bacterium]
MLEFAAMRAAVAEAQPDLDGALQAAEEALSRARSLSGDGPALLVTHLNRVGTLRHRTGDSDGAAAALEEAAAIIVARLGPDHFDRGNVLDEPRGRRARPRQSGARASAVGRGGTR